MGKNFNQLGQQIGTPVDNWCAPNVPLQESLQGLYCRVEPLNIKQHAQQLFDAMQLDAQGVLWTYLPYGPFTNLAQYSLLLEKLEQQPDQQFYVIVDLSDEQAVGVAAYLRINPDAGSIEIGHLCYSPLLQKTIMATEAMYLMMAKVFNAGYRRYEWKCNALNQASKSSAIRLGFQFEGIFRQAQVVDGCNRDTAWFSIIDSEWMALKNKFETWLAAFNFDDQGQQVKSLQEC
ncbi:Protein export cytoplasm protein SecA ATPase RNA helicase (TC 3.A.5.1.1) [hydrothermal vent metagenome]|uniref:Protein export cytoplasm protein SecA ATPase RNA helicase (TC 3.A.5.1.1) n=1 Tax=hydrothermal vent metagenome TaxID=652676 RepID=A0A3B1B4L2_9ZZZZ